MSIGSPSPARLVHSLGHHQRPLVSIIIPTFRRHEMLVDALNSALQQDVDAPVEIIVVDNDPESTAPTLKAISPGRSGHQLLYFINDSNLGMFGNWNQGIALARGRWITLLHDDDWLSPDFLKVMLPLVHSHADVAVCRVAVGNAGYDPSTLKRPQDSDHVTPITVDDLIYGNLSPAPGIILTRKALVDVGGFDPNAYPTSDYVTYAHCAVAVPAVRINRTLAYYRTTDSQTFKGNTLQLMIDQSIQIKQNLLEQATWFSTLTYILSVAFWFRLAKANHVDIKQYKRDWRHTIADLLSSSRPTTLFVEAIRRACKQLSRTLRRITTLERQ